jgi:alcohol dehydrogenase YqhD (iron-dependent ADH family)
MMDFTYLNPVSIHFGRDSVKQLPEEIRKYGSRVLLVYGGNSLKASGNYDVITAELVRNGISWVDFGGNTAPSYRKVLEAIDLCKRENIDAIIGIGGCSCMDMAKIIAFGVKNDKLWDYLSHGLSPKGKETLPVGEIPTFPSGGSEVDAAAEIDDFESGEHGALYGIHPAFAILNPEFTFSVDKKNTAYGALVTFAQACSCYLCGSGTIAGGFCETVLKAIIQSVKTALGKPDEYEARANLMWASALTTSGLLSCGKESSWSLYASESIAEKLFPVSYREAVAVIFPKWLREMALNHAENAYRYAVNVMCVEPAGKTRQTIVGEGIARTEEFYKQCGIAVTYNEIAKLPDTDEIQKVLEAAEADDELSPSQVKEMILKCVR